MNDDGVVVETLVTVVLGVCIVVNAIQKLMREYHRCEVCGLPLPHNEPGTICSRRCASNKALSEDLHANRREQLENAILTVVARLGEDATICPGTLARRVLPGMKDPLRLLRPLLFLMQQNRRIRLSQKGKFLPWWKIRGPFRVAKLR